MNIGSQHHLHISLFLREHHLDAALRRYCDLGSTTDAETASQIRYRGEKKNQTQKKPSCTAAET